MSTSKDVFNTLTNLLCPGDEAPTNDMEPGYGIWCPAGTYGGGLDVEAYDAEENIGVARAHLTPAGWAFKVRTDLGILWPAGAIVGMYRVELYNVETVVTHGALAAELGEKLRTHFYLTAQAVKI